MKRSEKGQSVLEYVIILTAIVLALALAAGGPITRAINHLMVRASDSISGAADILP